MDWMKAGIVAGDMKLEHGWLFTTKAGTYGTTMRSALVTAIGLGANRLQDAVYPTSGRSGYRRQKYSGEKKYVMRF